MVTVKLRSNVVWDAVVVGAGPAGALAATILARSGARVLVVDRARFPRDKLCGDSFNPGTLSLLRRLNLASWLETNGLPIEGMLLTGPSGVRVEGRYPRSLAGRTAMRRDVDHWLLGQAIRAGAQFEECVAARRAVMEFRPKEPYGARVTGIVVRLKTHGDVPLNARVVIAADGRRSALAFGLGLAAPLVRPRRWAVGAYFEDVAGALPLGEMHIRTREYLGVAPLPRGLTNACLVAPIERFQHMSDPARALRVAIDREPILRDRFARARMVAPPVVLGPLAVDVHAAGVPGLLLAGDAAGFIDPITGDGLRFALRGAELAAETALEMLATGRPDGYVSLATRRRTAFSWKWRLNRTLRRIVDSPMAMCAAERGAWAAPVLIQSLVAAAGDCAARA
jgi:flavin-dependent dehydrogenase